MVRRGSRVQEGGNGMSDSATEIWNYIHDEIGRRTARLEGRVTELETRLRDHEQTVPHEESQS